MEKRGVERRLVQPGGIAAFQANFEFATHRSPDITGHLIRLLFSFRLPFVLLTKAGLFLLFPFSFILLSLITHICFSFLENDSCQTVATEPCSWRIVNHLAMGSWNSPRQSVCHPN